MELRFSDRRFGSQNSPAVTLSMNVELRSCELSSQLPFSVRKSFALSALLTGFSVRNRFRCEIGSQQFKIARKEALNLELRQIVYERSSENCPICFGFCVRAQNIPPNFCKISCSELPAKSLVEEFAPTSFCRVGKAMFWHPGASSCVRHCLGWQAD